MKNFDHFDDTQHEMLPSHDNNNKSPTGPGNRYYIARIRDRTDSCQEKQENHLINWYFKFKINTHFNYYTELLSFDITTNKTNWNLYVSEKIKIWTDIKINFIVVVIITPAKLEEKWQNAFKSVKHSDTFCLHICLYKDYISVAICSGCCGGNILQRIKIILCIN